MLPLLSKSQAQPVIVFPLVMVEASVNCITVPKHTLLWVKAATGFGFTVT